MLLTQLNDLSVVPFRVIPPPSAVVLVGVVTSPRITFLSSTTKLVVLMLVVVPLTVRSPDTVRFPERVEFPVTPRVPEMDVLPLVESTVNLFVVPSLTINDCPVPPATVSP